MAISFLHRDRILPYLRFACSCAYFLHSADSKSSSVWISWCSLRSLVAFSFLHYDTTLPYLRFACSCAYLLHSTDSKVLLNFDTLGQDVAMVTLRNLIISHVSIVCLHASAFRSSNPEYRFSLRTRREGYRSWRNRILYTAQIRSYFSSAHKENILKTVRKFQTT